MDFLVIFAALKTRRLLSTWPVQSLFYSQFPEAGECSVWKYIKEGSRHGGRGGRGWRGGVNQPQSARLRADHQWHSAALHIRCEWHAAAPAHFSPLRDHLWARRQEEDMHKTRLRPWGWCVDGRHGCRKFTDTESLLWNQRGQTERSSVAGHMEGMMETPAALKVQGCERVGEEVQYDSPEN